MTDQEIARIQKELEDRYINQPNELENMIKHTSERIANDIVNGAGVSHFTVNDTEYFAKAIQAKDDEKRYLGLVITDVLKYKIAGARYKPFMLQCEITNDMSWKDNIQAVAETWLRHIFGCDVVEEIE